MISTYMLLEDVVDFISIFQSFPESIVSMIYWVDGVVIDFNGDEIG